MTEVEFNAVAPSTTVVVINYNGGTLVLKCLAALRQQTCRNFITVVVDNASTDDSPQQIAALFPEVCLLPSITNRGFAGGVNFALAHAVQGEWFALLNPDAFPEPAWLENLLAAGQRHPEAAAFGSLMLRADGLSDGEEVIDGVGDAYHISGLPWRIGHGRRAAGAQLFAQEIFSPCAAAALYRTAAVRACDGMDAELFCYLEDVDLGFRLRLAGYACRFVPEAVVRHVGSAITGLHSEFQTYHGHRNLVRVFVKNMPAPLFWFLLPLHLLMNFFSLALLILYGRGRPAWRSKRDAMLGLRQAWHACAAVQKTRRVSLLRLLRHFAWVPLRR